MAPTYLHLWIVIFISFGAPFLCEDLPDEEPLPDYYGLLQLTQDATIKEIKRSFRKLALKYHPDKNAEPQAEAIFKELSEAYAVLSDPEKKLEYDEVLKEEAAGQPPSDQPLERPQSAQERPERPAAGQQSSAQERSEKPSPQERPAEEKPLHQEERPTPGERPEESHRADEQAQPTKPSSTKSWSVFDDLDEEALVQVLTFLASNEFIITKRVSTPTRYREEYFDNEYHRSKRSAQGGAHLWEEHNTWRSADSPTWRSADSSSCRTSIRWEGAVKVTSTFC